MNRKKLAKGNIGGRLDETLKPYFLDPNSQSQTNVVMVERMLLQLLRGEVDRFADRDQVADFRKFMSHFFDPLAGEDARETFIKNFQAKPPSVVLNYPRATTELPCFAVLLEAESEQQNMLADGIGETLGDDEGPAATYSGSFWENTYGIYVYAEHPDVCVYLYQLAKMILFGAKPILENGGFRELRFSGTEMLPDDSLVPENVFMRTLRISGTTTMSVPEYAPDPAKFRIGVYREDVIVDGLHGGVKTYAVGEE